MDQENKCLTSKQKPSNKKSLQKESQKDGRAK